MVITLSALFTTLVRTLADGVDVDASARADIAADSTAAAAAACVDPLHVRVNVSSE